MQGRVVVVVTRCLTHHSVGPLLATDRADEGTPGLTCLPRLVGVLAGITFQVVQRHGLHLRGFGDGDDHDVLQVLDRDPVADRIQALDLSGFDLGDGQFVQPHIAATADRVDDRVASDNGSFEKVDGGVLA